MSSTFGMRLLDGEVQAEPTAFPGLALDLYSSAVRLHHVAHQVQTEAVAAPIRVVTAMKAIEDARLLVTRDADAVVLHFDGDGPRPAPGTQFHLLRVTGILAGVIEQVLHRLLDGERIYRE
jgi:hypothetical protein